MSTIQCYTYTSQCAVCGASSNGKTPKGLYQFQYGPILMAMITLGLVYFNWPFGRVAKMVAQDFGVAISEGSLVTVIIQVSRWAEHQENLLLDQMREQGGVKSIISQPVSILGRRSTSSLIVNKLGAVGAIAARPRHHLNRKISDNIAKTIILADLPHLLQYLPTHGQVCLHALTDSAIEIQSRHNCDVGNDLLKICNQISKLQREYSGFSITKTNESISDIEDSLANLVTTYPHQSGPTFQILDSIQRISKRGYLCAFAKHRNVKINPYLVSWEDFEKKAGFKVESRTSFRSAKAAHANQIIKAQIISGAMNKEHAFSLIWNLIARNHPIFWDENFTNGENQLFDYDFLAK